MNKSAPHRGATAWYFSASQLKSANDCLRLWAWEQICGIREPSAPAAALGTDVHTVLERWLLHGTPPNPYERVGEIAVAGLHFLPPPGPELEIEREFKLKIGNYYYRGKVDVGFVAHDRVPWVIDHKTTSDFGWMLTPDMLIDDVQALLYAKDALDRYGVDEVHLRWVYYRTRKPYAAQVSDLRITRAQVDARWPVIDELARDLEQIHQTVTDPLTLPPSAQSCGKYRGCPHIQRCNLTPEERITSIMNQSDIVARMKARAATRPANNTPAASPSDAVPANRAHAAPETPTPQRAAQTPPPVVQQTSADANAAAAAATAAAAQAAAAAAVAKAAAAAADAAAAAAAAQQTIPAVEAAPPPSREAPIPTAWNPPDQPARAVQRSNIIEHDVAAPQNRAGEQEASALTQPKKTRGANKATTGFAVTDRRTAMLLIHAAAAASGDPNAIDNALMFAGQAFTDLAPK